uniref:Uncharacterized protein n=1 Tax=Candidatus Kentrum sp. SD TaxID=2126332 RepID=A0A451BM05_9GAMM|nr:MAG: hypothetical protein BECKSD772D_GA0070982_104222 [Candidatus Kentron sp. SD]
MNIVALCASSDVAIPGAGSRHSLSGSGARDGNHRMDLVLQITNDLSSPSLREGSCASKTSVYAELGVQDFPRGEK